MIRDVAKTREYAVSSSIGVAATRGDVFSCDLFVEACGAGAWSITLCSSAIGRQRLPVFIFTQRRFECISLLASAVVSASLALVPLLALLPFCSGLLRFKVPRPASFQSADVAIVARGGCRL